MKNPFKTILDALKKFFGVSAETPKPVPAPTPKPTPAPTPKPEPTPAPTPKPDPTPAKSLKDLPVVFGVAMKATRFDNKEYIGRIKENVRRIAGENAFKSSRLCKVRGKIGETSEAETLLKFAKDNGMKVHAQCIIWPKQTIGYLAELEKNTKLTTKDWEGILKEFVQTWMKFFKGKVESCDVVNEAFNASYEVAKKGPLRDCVWLRKLGPDYISLAFKYAAQIDSKMSLFLADYDHEFGGKKMENLKKVVADMQKNKVPIHGLSLQMHTRIGITRADRAGALKLAANTGLLVYISELDMAVRSGLPKNFEFTASLQKQQADRTFEFFQDYLTIVPKKQQFGISTWGVGDDDSNINDEDPKTDYPLFFDKDYKPKLVYNQLLKLTEK